MTRVAIIVGSTRIGRQGDAVAQWVYQGAHQYGNAQYEIVDLADLDLPLRLDEPRPAAVGPDYQHRHTRAWSQIVNSFDAFVFVVPEYNHSIPAVLKNALDFLYVEWADKVAGFVSYGFDNGVRAVEHLRGILSELGMAHVRRTVALSVRDDFENGKIGPREHQSRHLLEMLDKVLEWADCLRPLRAQANSADVERPTLGITSNGLPNDDMSPAASFIAEIQAGLDSGDAEIYNRHFAADVLWGSPFGAALQGYEELHQIHRKLLGEGVGSTSRYELERMARPTPDVMLLQVRRTPSGSDKGQIVSSVDDAFAEMALYVLVRRNGRWWLAAGQNTPVDRSKGVL